MIIPKVKEITDGFALLLGSPSYIKSITDRSKAMLLLFIVFVSYASCWCVLC